MDNFTHQVLQPKSTEASLPPVIQSPKANPAPPQCGWEVLFNFCAVFGLLGATVGVLMTLGGGQSGPLIGIIGIVSCIQSLFMAFVVKLLNEMRWYLAKISNAHS